MKYKFDKQVDRQISILLPLLYGTCILSFIALLINLISYLKSILGLNYIYGNGSNVLPMLLFFSLFIYLVRLTKKGKTKVAAIVLVVMYGFSGLYSAFTWGVDIPQALLMYALTIILGGILLGSKFGIFVTIIVILCQYMLTYLQSEYYLAINKFWKSNFIDYRDTLITSITLSIIAIVSWLSNREIESSLHRAESSEKALKKERDMLEVRVQERTRDLQKAQLEKLLQLQHFAGLGKLASGLIHELLNPLTVISLNLDDVRSQTHRLKQKAPSEMAQELDETIRRARDATLHIEKYVVAARKQIQQQSVSTSFSPKEELDQLLKLFSYRSKKDHIPLKVICPNDIHLKGDPIKFNQLMSILITNAFDAYSNSQKKNKTIALSIQQVGASIIISITDHGRGIPTDMQKKIFEPFFSTKDHSQGIGIGLSIAQEIVHVHFKGTITVSSSPDKATTFTITITSSKEVS